MTMAKSIKFSGYLIHIAAWAVILGMPLFVTRPDHPMVSRGEYVHFLLAALSFMAVFYVNYFILIDKFLSRRKIGAYLLSNILLISVVMLLIHLATHTILPPPQDIRPHGRPPRAGLLRFLLGNTCMYFLVAGISVAIKMTGQWYRSESLRKELEKTSTEAQLQNLKSQLNPHFLFNTLNNIYSLIQIDSDKAQEAVHDLSSMLRYVLYESDKDRVTVREEVSFLRDYIALMKIRLPRHATLQVGLPENPSEKLIAPLLFISPIENAFKHGVSNELPSHIDISLTETEDGHVRCEIHNSLFPKDEGDRSGSGIGIQNLQKRLSMIYPEKYTFTFGPSEGEYVTVLDIDLG